MRENRRVGLLHLTNKEELVFNMIRLKCVLNYNVSFLFSSMFVLTPGDFYKGAHAGAAATSNLSELDIGCDVPGHHVM